MARFRGTVQGNRSEASRLGHKRLDTSCNTWDIGVDCQAYIDMGGNDVIAVWVTGGSHNDTRVKLIATVRRVHGQIEIETNDSVTSVAE